VGFPGHPERTNGFCPSCGAPLADTDEVNPYEAPKAALGPDVELLDFEPVAPTSLLQKYAEAFQLLFSHLSLFSLVILTVWLPGNLLINAMAYSGANDASAVKTFQMNNILEGLFGPIHAAAMIYALARIKSGQKVTYFDAIGMGFRRWGSLFGARFTTGLLIMLGLFALVVPGIMMAIRFALVDPIVVLEGLNGSEARQESADLTRGHRWSIFGAYVLFFMLFLPLSFAVEMLFEEFEPLNNMAVSTIFDCGLDIAASLILIVLFLFYWERRPQPLPASGRNS
jgi:hypothetical protein